MIRYLTRVLNCQIQERLHKENRSGLMQIIAKQDLIRYLMKGTQLSTVGTFIWGFHIWIDADCCNIGESSTVCSSFNLQGFHIYLIKDVQHQFLILVVVFIAYKCGVSAFFRLLLSELVSFKYLEGPNHFIGWICTGKM